jgi:hypothetical protein
MFVLVYGDKELTHEMLVVGTENEYLHSWFSSQKIETSSDLGGCFSQSSYRDFFFDFEFTSRLKSCDSKPTRCKRRV